MLLTSHFYSFIQHFDWQKIGEQIASTVFQLLLVSVGLLLVNWLGKKIIRHLFKQYKATKLVNGNTNRIDTIFTLILNIFSYTVLFFWIYALLSFLGVPVGTLIAGAGIFSLALGLGAQGFVSDIVTGAFILMEEQINVGDAVKIGTIEGTVSAIGIRTTQVISADGTLNFIPNRNITIVSNKSRHEMRALVQIPIFPDSPIDEINNVIKNVNQTITSQFPAITQSPTNLGTVPLPDGKLVIQVVTFTQPGEQSTVQHELLSAYLKAISDANITLPTIYRTDSTTQ
ncbi:small-conductance mechanosensitive channel [Secundilactobacillus odoratitofui DSM 19909 = JCM 15043]|uniref:Small-conductance mechanosensitive channel n=1 Tax=Secundilactobacillus odoratitofui DSM 19909 = JCM 15043 TaxID=1423776 RepID=A0A0R1LUJ8_9LACO|nr:mechanosensitive ion channel family protein [Secundilactobacillus odoratitofui]KRK97251.1 small-conductance mechanosensitive channel [Secundilactobacillus odoratitofui DSM 19909 = JCM 15043]